MRNIAIVALALLSPLSITSASADQPQPPSAPSAPPSPEAELIERKLEGDMPAAPDTDPLIARGRYLSTIAGCNDCHTQGFAISGGSVPENEWLLGDSMGFRGPWGTTYPVNVRRYLSPFSEEQWVAIARNLKSRPPMPSYILNQMEEDDLRALYRFIRTLDPAGAPSSEAMPQYVAPGVEPKTPYIVFEPVNLPKKSAPAKSRK